MSHEKAIFDGVRTRLGVRKSREMTLRIHRLENNEYWKDRSSPQTSDTISPIRGPRPRPYEPVLAFRLAPLMAIAVRLGSSPHRRCHRRYRVVSGARITVRGSEAVGNCHAPRRQSGSATGRRLAIEDIFPVEWYLECINETYNTNLSEDLLPIDGNDQIVKRVESVLKERGRIAKDASIVKGPVLAEMQRRFEDMHEVKDLPKGTAALAKKLISKIQLSLRCARGSERIRGLRRVLLGLVASRFQIDWRVVPRFHRGNLFIRVPAVG